MLKYGEVNPLAVHGLRLTEICGSITLVERVGFEIPAEATYFAMFLDKINKNIGW